MDGAGEEEMKPWEQHSSVIRLPRFDYNAPSSLLTHSHSAFLITCTIKREKSATKEAINLLHNFLLNDDVSSKRRRLDNKDGGGGEVTTDLSLVKLIRNGLVLFIFPQDTFHDTVPIVSNIIQALESRKITLPLWCHRILPIQATCSLNEKELQEVVSMLVKKFVDANQDQLGRPLKFAVGFNRRGIEETKSAKENLNGSNSLLDRNKCFQIVGTAVNSVVKDSVVDLRSPELSVFVEVLPLSGVPNGSIVVAVSVLPSNLVSTKPRLSVKALNSNTKEGSVAQ
ncbi:putative THUMP domain-containing protein [Medicago truncatula]|uniref:Putative THUMP domain-containing protein n=1 Tax=Medicago truncatula TaxID=3880 RepID=A0A072VRE9_MEDTR|nr:uncharacterized protein LOC25485599 [Medicago truncatula]KEH44342.1 hypothetical protein MTR_1g112360 [Medicago truncatula]RHN82536.1 putative THUMP domain-containing protein [Medicago truncatula]